MTATVFPDPKTDVYPLQHRQNYNLITGAINALETGEAGDSAVDAAAVAAAIAAEVTRANAAYDVKRTTVTGVAVTTAAVHAALVTLGLITA